jgi:hypothetical protein
MRKVQSLQKEPFPLSDVITKTVPVPTDGWDALSPLALMDPKRAPILTNWVPRPGWVELRAGYNIWSTTGATYLTGQPVETLIIYRALGSEKMFAASNGSIYDVTTQYTSTSVVSGLANNRWQWINFTPALGTTVIQLVNGVDTLKQYNGTSWSIPSITGLPGGVGTNVIRNIAVQKRRIWYILNNGSGQGTTVAAFMPTDAISGVIAGTLDLGALWNKGGFLQAMANWTVDGGSGPNDYACFISSKGQISIYQGTDPTSANTWSLVGTFDLPPPIGDRCVTRIGSDVAVITLQGVLPLSTALPFDPSADRSVAITSRIQNAMSQSANFYSTNFGWQLVSYPLQTLLVLNVPQATNSSQVQYVMNTLTGAWCKFTGWNANCFELFNNNLYFGDNFGNVALAYTGGSDLFNTIDADMQCAFNYFDDPGRIKRLTMVQPLLTVAGVVQLFLSVDVSFGQSTAAAQVTGFTFPGAVWDVDFWDIDQWAAGEVNQVNFFSVNALGHALALRVKISFTSSHGQAGAIGAFDVGQFDSAIFDAGLSNINPNLKLNLFNCVLELGSYI